MKTLQSTFAGLLICFWFLLPAFHTQAQKTMDHPVVKPLDGSVLVPAQSKQLKFFAHSFNIAEGNKTTKVEKKGRYWKLRYLIKDTEGRVDKSISNIEIAQNYKGAAQEKGGDILYELHGRLTFTLPRKDGGKIWVYLQAGTGSYNLFIVEEAAFKRRLTFGAAEMKKALDEEGKVAVYGIHFDTDKDRLKLGAEKVLLEIVKLMKSNPELKIEIQGHTDNVGPAAHNLDLSKRRAASVKSFLLLYGIESSRMIPMGYGMEKPVASNETEEGRAQNRRVELQKLK